MADSYLCYRVEDEYSQARTADGRGIWPGDRHARVDFKARHGRKLKALARHVMNHLDWSNRRPTPFISMYNDDTVAFEEAKRRKRRGMKKVTITVIDVRCYGSVKNGFDSAILTKIPRMEKKKGLGRRQTAKYGAKRQARTCPVTTPQHQALSHGSI